MASYVRTLPASFSVPLFFSPAAVEELRKYPTMGAKVIKRARFVNDFASQRLAASESAAAFSSRAVGADAFGWAIAACSSRAFSIGGVRTLCPLVDVGNHASKEDANCEVRGTAGGGLEVVARRPIALGEEIRYCYGELSNDDFLQDYGFLPSSNPDDVP